MDTEAYVPQGEAGQALLIPLEASSYRNSSWPPLLIQADDLRSKQLGFLVFYFIWSSPS